MTSTPDAPDRPAQAEAAPAGHHIPEPEAGEGELPESAAPESFVDAPIAHTAHEQAQQPPQPPQPVPTTPTLEELELALAALDEVAPKGAVGEVHDALAEGGAHGQAQVVAIRHVSTLGGYPDWLWTVLLSRGLEGGPTVLEVALLPGETSLLAPAWVPWSERLADYLAAQDADETDADDEDDEDLDSDLEADLDDDFDDDFDVEDAVDDEDDDTGWDDEAGAESDAEPDDSRA